MNLQLPEVVETYFRISNGGDNSCVVDCFCIDATVIDENQTHQGIDAIEIWQRKAKQAFTYRVEPLNTSQENGKLNVKARVVGNFPGSPVELDHVFLIEHDLIRSLEIAP
ncbi:MULTISPECIES: nuclear transport factor 2 family protein [Halomonadaceae]|uniref:nuclear transport factor 2 family protein n=1 Tax=Halomonadaceae TaxID=28256 RepID=UPI001599E117|nr:MULTISPECIES: nuclear transport factor 2 family protein [Halomonas]QJQ95868.1 nuclear transport factor 2 family protein [Halomonas sp. PA5]